ncbi:MAG: serine/threonine protein kinase [Myxococcales bacterium]|jgi:hypothetical protein|nr:serine/threonine protein kinase [Myxococcales bacterium]
MIRTLQRLLPLAAALALLAGCGRPFKIQTAPGFIELENQAEYAYRATTPEGVVVAVRVVDDESRGDIDFWTKALVLQLRDVSGYALLSTKEVTSLDGTKGKELRFGHDEDNKPFVYVLSVYLAQGRLFLVEAGGSKEQMDRAQASVDWMMKSVKVKCDTFVSPVLASRTCNRW